MKFYFFACLLFTGLGLRAQTTSGKTANDFKVIGYYTPGSAEPESLPLNYLTHINYSFSIPAPSGDTLVPLRDDSILKRLVKHAHGGKVQVFISIGGWGIGDGGGEDGRFHRMAERAEGRKTFIKSTMDLVKKYDLDGVDLDWEYPDEDSQSADDYVMLVKDLAAQLHAQNKLLTAAVVARGKKGYGVKKEAFMAMDWINLMAYDGDFGGDIVKAHSPYAYAQESLNYWLDERKLPASKAVLGLPFYSKLGFGKFGPTYKQLVADGASAYDDYWKGAFYNGINTIEAKVRLAKQKGCAGVMIWEIGLDTADDTSLLKAIDRAKR
ncbi:glycosyl hydrolase family 18 protein [Persicitalea jodogahamensis]|uniref:chitinase n=1 Tax=Persicitalea jodogahamensis TaxID=402147 RepID=A0A8J3DA31_9BACT|nr:glycosyl hydrolase family 18 protein [Persicitalea jodogahamensis]GHB72656.1 chitinase [Persicitalea jodogahamensis]